MNDEIAITLYDTDPARVFWVVLKGNQVQGSGMEYARGEALQAAHDVALANARQVAQNCGLPDGVSIVYWRGVSTNYP